MVRKFSRKKEKLDHSLLKKKVVSKPIINILIKKLSFQTLAKQSRDDLENFTVLILLKFSQSFFARKKI